MVVYKPAGLDLVFHALAHPARRAMLQHLSDHERNLTELAAPLQMSFPAASKHVRVLERARLVRRRVVGRAHFCRIEGQPLAQANEWLEAYRTIWEANYQRLDALLDELQPDASKPDGSEPAPRRAGAKQHAPDRRSHKEGRRP
ncbi:MAG: winged helix-turn-helix transcriptional regulator [Phycisphaerales bacterium]|nr:winged helix-turn-helix transcriptional regulator [Phycisphaerales bacterium]